MSLIDFHENEESVEILLSKEYISYKTPIIGHSGASQRFKKSILYSSGIIPFSFIHDDKQKYIRFYKIAELKEDVSEIIISPAEKNTLIVDTDHIKGCHSYVGDCEVQGERIELSIRKDKSSPYKIQSEKRTVIFLPSEVSISFADRNGMYYPQKKIWLENRHIGYNLIISAR